MEEPEERGCLQLEHLEVPRHPRDKILCPFPHPWLVPHLPCLACLLPFYLPSETQLQPAVSQKAETLQHRPFQPGLSGLLFCFHPTSVSVMHHTLSSSLSTHLSLTILRTGTKDLEETECIREKWTSLRVAKSGLLLNWLWGLCGVLCGGSEAASRLICRVL